MVAILPILLYIGLLIGSQGFQETPARHAPALIIAMISHMVHWEGGMIESALNAPIHIFIHGGAWFSGRAHGNAHADEAFVIAGAHFVVPDFSSVKDLDGDLSGMITQLRQAISWIHKNAETEFGGNPDRIFISGYPSGAHLAAVLLTTDWPSIDPTLPRKIFHGTVLCIGMYELKPVSLSARREYVNFTQNTVEAFSPIIPLRRNIDAIGALKSEDRGVPTGGQGLDPKRLWRPALRPVCSAYGAKIYSQRYRAPRWDSLSTRHRIRKPRITRIYTPEPDIPPRGSSTGYPINNYYRLKL